MQRVFLSCGEDWRLSRQWRHDGVLVNDEADELAVSGSQCHPGTCLPVTVRVAHKKMPPRRAAECMQQGGFGQSSISASLTVLVPLLKLIFTSVPGMETPTELVVDGDTWLKNCD
jgi:hypothetical protein